MSRHAVRPLQVALAERLSHLDPHAWDSLTGHSVFLGRPFLSALERTAPANLSPRYVLLYLDDAPVAALVLQLVRVEGRSAISLTTPLGTVAQLFDERALVLGNLAAWGTTGLALAPGLSAEQASLVWAEALRVIDRVRRFEKVEGHVNVSFVKDAASLEDARALEHAGYRRVPSGPDMVLTVDPAWKTFDGYLASLASKRRRAVKKTLEDTAAAGYRLVTLDVPALERHAVRLEQLYAEVWANAEVRPLKLSGAFFAELQRQLRTDCVVVGLEREGQLDGFGVSLRSGAQGVGYYLGFDRSKRDAPLYLRLLTSVIEQGMAWGVSQISMGRTAEEPKARLGAAPGEVGLWVKHRTPPLNWAVGAILQSIQGPKVEAHRVFKSDPAPTLQSPL